MLFEEYWASRHGETAAENRAPDRPLLVSRFLLNCVVTALRSDHERDVLYDRERTVVGLAAQDSLHAEVSSRPSSN